MQVKPRALPHTLALTTAVLLVSVNAPVFCTQRPAQQITLGLRITSPAGGTVVHSGEAITVTVAPLPGIHPSFVGLLAKFPLEVSACASQPCHQFTLTVPATIARAGVYSINAIGAVGAPGAGSVVASGTKDLDVEPSAAITNLNINLLSLVFQHAGERFPLIVRGGFADGTSMDIFLQPVKALFPAASRFAWPSRAALQRSRQ